MRYFLVLAGVVLTLLLALELFHFRDYRQTQNTQVASEHFIRDGRLGRILLKHEMVSIAPDSHRQAILDECADSGDLGYGEFLNQFRVRARVTSPEPTILTITVAVGPRGEQTYYRQEHITEPGRDWYHVNFRADRDTEIYVKYAILPETTATLIDAEIEGRFNRTRQVIVAEGKPVNAIFRSVNLRNDFSLAPEPGTTMHGKIPEITMHVPEGIEERLYTGNNPAKNAGFCNYIATQFEPGISGPGGLRAPLLLPRVRITTDEENLYGPTGIIDNKQAKGIWWEKPATLSVSNQTSINHQKVGLRFHGGTPGRKKDIESYRVYARKRFGLPTIDAEAITGQPSALGFRTLVFKYTFQSLLDRNVDFNPFIHSLALDVATLIGAIVPRYHLVDLEINDQHKGLYLALEHLSDRTLAHWLGHDDFVSYSYKSFNTTDQSVALFSTAGKILSTRGEETLATLKQHMDVNNVINSILLTAYIGDDDYCQGVELMTEKEDVRRITSINWDLDHGFFRLDDNGDPFIDPTKFAFRPINPVKSKCVRQWMFGWTYLQSAEFRQQLRARMEQLLDTSLSADNAATLVDYYRALDQQEFAGRYAETIDALEDFLRLRPAELRRQLEQMENQVAQIDPQQVEDWK